MRAEEETEAAAPPRPGRLLVPVLVFLGMVVAVVSSLGAPLIPTVAAVDHVSLSDAQWSLTVTFLVSAVATPLMGRLGDGPHRKAVILTGLAAVIAGGLLAALPLGFAELLVGRGLQGVGLGLTPLGMSVARDALPPERARPTVALLSITTAAGMGLGYPITGLIAEYAGLHAAYWFGVAVSVLALVAAVRVVPAARRRARAPLDVLGAVLLGAALAGLLLALSEGDGWGWVSPRLLGVVAASLVALAGWAYRERRCAHPLVDLGLLRHRNVLVAHVTAVLAGLGIYLLISLVTRYVQTPVAGHGLGTSVFVTGLMLLPFSAGSFAAMRLTPAVTRRVPPLLVLPAASVTVLLSTLMFACARGALWEVAVVMGGTGLGVGVIFALLPGLIVGAVPPGETGSATSFNQVIRYVGYAAGSTASAAVLEAATPGGQALPGAGGYTVAGLTGCAVWVVTAVVCLILPRVRGRGRPAPAAGPGPAAAAPAGAGDASSAEPTTKARTPR